MSTLGIFSARSPSARSGINSLPSDSQWRLLTRSRSYVRLAGHFRRARPPPRALSNLVFSSADQEIVKLALENRLTYSRYADDLTFSGLRPIPRSFTIELSRILEARGFALNPRKTRFAGPSQAKYVTGLVVNVRPQVDRRTRRKLRAMFHQARVDPVRFADRSNEMLGWASYVQSFDFARGQRYISVAKSLQQR